MEFHLVLALLLSGLIGVSLGMLGGGGSILATPVLVYVAGVGVRESIAMSLAIVGTTSLVASLTHWRKGNVHLPVAIIFGLAGMLGAIPGSWVTRMVSGEMLLLLFGTLMLVIGALMFFRRQGADSGDGADITLNLPLTLSAGFGVGFLTGFLGVGGGFLIVPALVLLTKLPMRMAIGTSLLVIAINSASGFIAHISHGHLPLMLTAAFTALAVSGAIIGQRMASKVSAARLRQGFAVLVVVLGLFLFARNFNALL